MEQGGESPLPHFVLQNRGAVVVGVAGMDDERQAGFARGLDVNAEDALRYVARRMVIVIVEARFAQSDAFWMLRQSHQRLDGRLGLFVRMVRMRPDGAKDLRIGFSNRLHALEARQMRRDRDHSGDAARLCAGDRLREFWREIGKVEVTMGIDEHQTRSGKSNTAWPRALPRSGCLMTRLGQCGNMARAAENTNI